MYFTKNKCDHHRISTYFGLSSVKRVLGSPENFQSAVNAFAILLIALTKPFFEEKIIRSIFWKKIENSN